MRLGIVGVYLYRIPQLNDRCLVFTAFEILIRTVQVVQLLLVGVSRARCQEEDAEGKANRLRSRYFHDLTPDVMVYGLQYQAKIGAGNRTMVRAVPGPPGSQRMSSWPSLPLNFNVFRSLVTASTLLVRTLVVQGCASARIRKGNLAIGPFAIGFCPPARMQTYTYDSRCVQVSDFPDSFAALAASGLPTTSRSCAGKIVSHFNVSGPSPTDETREISMAILSPGEPETDET